MKQKDIALIAVCVIVSGVLSLVLANILFGTEQRQQRVEVVDKITPEFVQPDTRYFNDQSINPTQQIQIGNNSNQTPTGQ